VHGPIQDGSDAVITPATAKPFRHPDDARQFVVVLQLCIEKDVDLLFG
jgi:hypothetical protein